MISKKYLKYREKILLSDPSGNPVTQIVQSVGVTDISGNLVTGIKIN